MGQTFLSATLLKMLKIRKRRLPHWTLEGSTYFITFDLFNGRLTEEERLIVQNHIREGHSKFCKLIAVQVMPDHVHIILKPNDGISFSRIMKGIKGVSARLVNKHRGKTGTVWLDESYDRIVRDQDEMDEKLRYMFENPIRAGLVEYPEDYTGWYFQEK